MQQSGGMHCQACAWKTKPCNCVCVCACVCVRWSQQRTHAGDTAVPMRLGARQNLPFQGVWVGGQSVSQSVARVRACKEMPGHVGPHCKRRVPGQLQPEKTALH